MSTKDTLSGGPRCSFCGVSLEERERMICGPDVRICDRCVRKAAGQIDLDSETDQEEDNNLPDPDAGDHDRAFQVYARLQDPIKDLLRRQYRARAVRVIAVTVAYYREMENMELGSAGDAALQSCLNTCWPDEHRN